MSADDYQPTYVRLPKALHSAVKERAAAEDRTMAQIIRFALRFYLAQPSLFDTPPTQPQRTKKQ